MFGFKVLHLCKSQKSLEAHPMVVADFLLTSQSPTPNSKIGHSTRVLSVSRLNALPVYAKFTNIKFPHQQDIKK